MSALVLRSRVALALLLALAAVPRRGEAAPANRPVRAKTASVVPLFDANKRFRPKKTFKLRFRALQASGAPVKLTDIAFALRHGPAGDDARLPARELKKGVFEVPFTPAGPGQYAVVASIAGTPAGSVAPVRLGVLGVADGIIEEPPEADVEAARKARKPGGSRRGR